MNEVTILAPNEVVEQLEASERLPQDIDPDTLRKYFTLTRPDLEQVDQCRGATNKLGFAVQLCTVRWRGHFLRDTREIPEPVLETLSLQLGVLPIPIDDYPQNEKTRFDHLERIRQHLKFIRCDASQRERLLQHLTDTAQALPRSTASHRWLLEQKIVRPGRTTLRDVIGTALETALENAYIQLSNTLAPGQAEAIEALLVIATPPEGDDANHGPWSRSRLELFKAMPRKESPEALLALLDRLSEIGSLGLSGLSALTEVHPATRRMLANWGYRYNVWKLRRFASAKRIAIVLCFLHAARAETTDAIVEMQDKLITAVHSKARQRYEDLLRATEEARSRAVEILEELGTVVLGSRQHPCRNLL